MDIFGSIWEDHEKKIIDNWIETVGDKDLVLLAGDTSWALRIEDAFEDLKIIDRLPGKKIIIKGNHDYWWSSQKKLNDLNLESISFIQNNSFIYGNIGIFGTRGWSSIDSDLEDDHNKKIYARELNRLRLSLESMKANIEKKIVILHYPPFNLGKEPNDFFYLMKEYGVDTCIYGHLHDEGHKFIIEDVVDGIDLYCVSSDYIDFKLKKIL